MKDRIKKLRKQLGLNQTDFGSQIGASQAMITSYETGRVTPDETMRILICNHFGIRREWLEFGEEPMNVSDMPNAPEALVPDLVAVLSEYPSVLDMFQRVVGHMTPADWQRLNSLLDEMQETKKEPPQP